MLKKTKIKIAWGGIVTALGLVAVLLSILNDGHTVLGFLFAHQSSSTAGQAAAPEPAPPQQAGSANTPAVSTPQPSPAPSPPKPASSEPRVVIIHDRTAPVAQAAAAPAPTRSCHPRMWGIEADARPFDVSKLLTRGNMECASSKQGGDVVVTIMLCGGYPAKDLSWSGNVLTEGSVKTIHSYAYSSDGQNYGPEQELLRGPGMKGRHDNFKGTAYLRYSVRNDGSSSQGIIKICSVDIDPQISVEN